MLPGCICFIVFVIQPIITGAYMSFFETQGFEAVKFVGLQNYKDVITDSLFLKSVLNFYQILHESSHNIKRVCQETIDHRFVSIFSNNAFSEVFR